MILGILVHAINATGIGDGGEGSPLSPTSQVSELLRVIQFAIAGGIWYLINQVKKNHRNNDEAHGQVSADIAEVRNLAQKNYEANQQLIRTVQTEIKAELDEISKLVKSQA